MRSFLFMILFITLLWAEKFDIQKIYYKSYDYEKMGAYTEAIKVLMPLYLKYPKGYTLNLRLAWLFYLSKRYENAIDHYKKAAMILPSSLEPKLGLAMVYVMRKDFNHVKNIATTIIKIDPYNYYGNYYLTLALLALKNQKDAVAVATKMLTLYPTDVKFLTLLARGYKKIDPKKMKLIYKDILILDPNNIEAKEALK